MSEQVNEELQVTISGHPGNPEGEAGVEMLQRMNNSHFELTGWAFDFLKVEPEDSVLDIGCGGGMTLKRLSALASKGKLFGIDISDVSVEQSCKMNEADVKSGKTLIQKGSVEKLPYSDNSFDKIITVESFYFWPDPVENLKEVYRVLKPEGRFLLVADIYEKPDLPEEARENIKRFNLTNPTPDGFIKYFADAGMKASIHLISGKDWIAVECVKKL